MGELVDSYHMRLSTDFAILGAIQQQVLGLEVETQTYAASGPGAVAMCAGTKYADLDVTLERWDERPPPSTDEWEDRDELPWQGVADGGPLKVRGFDGEHPGGLDVTGMGRARAIVLATGRHRYGYADDVSDFAEPERWLVRLFPDADALDAMAGPRRRISGALPFEVVRDSWQLALHGWTTGGWTSLGIAAFDDIHRALVRAGSPVTADQLLETVRLGGNADLSWDTVYFGPPTPPPGYPFEIPPDEVTPDLARVSGVPLHTLGDGLECLLRLGLVARVGRADVLVPTSTSAPAWDLLNLSPQRRAAIRVQGLQRGSAPLAGDLKQLTRWARQGVLTASLSQIAERLALTTYQVRGAAELLIARRQISIDTALADIDDDAPLNAELTSENPRGTE